MDAGVCAFHKIGIDKMLLFAQAAWPRIPDEAVFSSEEETQLYISYHQYQHRHLNKAHGKQGFLREC